jgi:membrane protease YdiL (CAAX protease family)
MATNVSTVSGAYAKVVSPSRIWVESVQLVIAYLLLEGALWSEGVSQLIWGLLAFGLILAFTLTGDRTARDLGLTGQNTWRQMWVVPAACLVAGIMMVAGSFAGTLHGITPAHAPLGHAMLYGFWSLMQEFMLQAFIFVRLERMFASGRTAAIVAAVLFSAAHIPSAPLVLATFTMGFVFSELYRRYRDIYALGVAHGILGLAYAASLPDSILHHMKVGMAYLH